MSISFALKATIAGAALAAAAGAQAATINNLVVNGSFESPNIRTNSISQFTNLSNPDDPFGWLTGVNGVELRDSREFPTGYRHVAADGQQYVELAVERNSSIFQDIFLRAGQEYTLSFAYSPRAPYGSALNQAQVSLGSWLVNLVADASNQAPSNAINLWQVYTMTLVPQVTGVQRLQFAATGSDGRYGMFFDNVSLTATPLPGAALLFATSLAGFMAARKRRRNEEGQAAVAAA